MSNDPRERSPESDADLEREIRAQRKFSLAEAIGRMAGPGMMKGVSPVTRKRQAEAAIEDFPAGDSEPGSVSAPSLVTPTRCPLPGSRGSRLQP